MSRLLSICIPTYNRAQKLRAQLEVVISLTNKYVNECEIIVSDNHSTDATPLIIKELQQKYPERIKSYQQSVNVGFVNNYRFLIGQATSEYLWVLGDDDPVYNTILDVFFSACNKQSASVFHFNHRCITAAAEVIHQNYYTLEEDLHNSDGEIAFQQIADEHYLGGLMFISASIMNSKAAKQALVKWKGSMKNQALPLYVAAFSATQNGMYVVAKNQLDCQYNESFWMGQQENIYLHDVNEILAALRTVGYPKRFILDQMKINFYSNIGWPKFKQIVIRKPLYGLRICWFVFKTVV